MHALDAAFTINPRAPEALAHRGRVKIGLGRFDEAEADLMPRSLSIPCSEIAWEGKAHHGLLRNRIAQAMHASHKVLE